jgi:hypothetical protein
LMQRVSREIALESPNPMNAKTCDPTVALKEPPWTCKANHQHKQGNLIPCRTYIDVTSWTICRFYTPNKKNPLHVKENKNFTTLTGESLGKKSCWISDKHW